MTAAFKKLKLPWQVAACSLFVLLFTTVFSFIIFDHIPHINDEVAYLFHAKIFKTGRLYADSPCAKEFFNFTHVINNGRWYSQYPPGYPFLLMIALFAGIPWMANPLLAAGAVILLFFLGKEVYDRRTGIFASFFGAVSIWYLVMSSTMMSHTSGMFFFTLFLLFLFKSIRSPSLGNGAAAGLSWGIVFLIRPQVAVSLCVPFLIYYAVRFLKNWKLQWKSGLAMGLAALGSVGVLMVFNAATNGDPLTMGYTASHGAEHGFGFGKPGYIGIPHTPYRGVEQIGEYLVEINRRLFGWPISSFLIFIPLLFIRRANREHARFDLLFISGIAAIFIPLFFYWGVFIILGARMVFEAVPLFFLLAARGAVEASAYTLKVIKKPSPAWVKRGLLAVSAVFILYAFGYSLPNWIWVKESNWYYHGFDNNYALVTPKIHHTMQQILPRKSMVLFKLLYHPNEYFPEGWMGSGFQYNDPELKNNLIFGKYLDAGLDDLFRCYPDRKIFLYYGTLSMGMVLPLEWSETGGIRLGRPLHSREPADGKSIRITENPLDFYTLYSSEFTDFISSLVREQGNIRPDVLFLKETGDGLLSDGDYRAASFHYEAALQIEKHPQVRFYMLTNLAQCYLKIGNRKEAMRITSQIDLLEETKNYNVIPERGF